MSIYFSHGNKLLPSTDKYIVRIFNIPAISVRDKNGDIDKNHPNICIEAPEICKEICYAYARQSGREIIVYGRRKENYDETLKSGFTDEVIKKVTGTARYYKSKNVKIFIRIHESGDFYSIDYLDKWVKIADHFRNDNKIIFMAYTKNIKLLNNYLKQEKLKLSDINITFKYSVMELSEHEGRTFKKTSDYPEKLKLANALRKEGLTFYTLFKDKSELPVETPTLKHCVLGSDKDTCATCNMKCYLENIDIAAIAR